MRLIQITGVSAGVSFSARGERDAEPEFSSNARVELTGTMDEPIRDTREVEIVVYPKDDPRPGKDPVPWIGLIHGIKPVMRPAIFVSHADSNRVWTLALSGMLKHAYMVLTPPRYQTAFVVHIAFSTHAEELKSEAHSTMIVVAFQLTCRAMQPLSGLLNITRIHKRDRNRSFPMWWNASRIVFN